MARKPPPPDEDEDGPSERQQAWMQLAAQVRAELANHITALPGGDVDKLKTFVTAAQDLFWLEINACTFDAECDKRARGFE